MAKKKVCCSFDYEHDRHYYNLLRLPIPKMGFIP